jgi:hypothetical protein
MNINHRRRRIRVVWTNVGGDIRQTTWKKPHDTEKRNARHSRSCATNTIIYEIIRDVKLLLKRMMV